MRPLPVERLNRGTPGLLGVSIIRGEPVPVIDLGASLGLDGEAAPTRFVTVRTSGRIACLSVEAVLDTRRATEEVFHELPPLLNTPGAAMAALGALDGELLVLLRAARAVPNSVWRDLDAGARGT